MAGEPKTRLLAERLAALGPLADPARRSLYLYVAAQPEEVGRDDAASATGTSRAVAAFHLDKLVEGGLLEAGYRRLNDRRGPGAGRPAKVYRRSAGEHAVSLPPREYELAARLLARALEAGASAGAKERTLAPAALDRVARRYGEGVGREVRQRLGGRAGRERRLAALEQALADHGYQPYRDGSEVRLGNCPFQALAEEHRELVCGMNVALLAGALGGMESGDLVARRDAGPSGCCVAVGSTRAAPGRRPRRPPGGHEGANSVPRQEETR